MLIIAIGVFLFQHQLSHLENDAARINDLGIIRGSIQRVVKLELAGKPDEAIILLIDKTIMKYRKDYAFEEEQGKDSKRLLQLEAKWNTVKTAIREYRKNPSVPNEAGLVALSEECWTMANDIVFRNQNLSEKKLSYFEPLIAIMAVNILLIFALLFITKIYVRDKLEVSAIYDPLTGVFNRRYLKEFLEREVQRVERKKGSLSLIMYDIDHFKRINDTYGHNEGDSVLKTLSQRVGHIIRKYDVLARFGGEEFIIILPDTEPGTASALAERIRADVENYRFRTVEKITISLGVTGYSPGDGVEELTRRADEALYRAKNGGRNKVEFL